MFRKIFAYVILVWEARTSGRTVEQVEASWRLHVRNGTKPSDGEPQFKN
jgi:hypothetical protein